jgi:hypothetical protein
LNFVDVRYDGWILPLSLGAQLSFQLQMLQRRHVESFGDSGLLIVEAGEYYNPPGKGYAFIHMLEVYDVSFLEVHRDDEIILLMLRKKRFGKEHIVHTIHHLVD